MKPVIAQRLTYCHHCLGEITRGSERLDDIVRLDNRIKRFYYHKDCFIQRVQGYFESVDRSPVHRPSYGGGRTKILDLTPEETEYRHKLLARLGALRRYYLPKLALTKPIKELTSLDLKRFKNFHNRRQEILIELEKCGGIPAHQAIDYMVGEGESVKIVEYSGVKTITPGKEETSEEDLIETDEPQEVEVA